MARSEVTYRPKGTTGYQSELTTAAGSMLTLVGDLAEPEPQPSGSQALLENPAVVMSLWAYSKHELLARRSRSAEVRRAQRKAANHHLDLSRSVADLVDLLSLERRTAWCSGCFEMTEHQLVQGKKLIPSAYLCRACGSPTTPCLGPGCTNMANRGLASAHLPRYCAEHRHDVPSFDKLTARLADLEDLGDWLAFEKAPLAKITRIATIAGVSAAVLAPAALVAAPAIGGFLGASSLGGSLTGAAATSHGLAMLGGGSLAAGGLGMAGGTAVVVATGAALGGVLGGAATSAYVRDDKSFRIEKLRSGSGTPVVLASGFLTEKENGWGEWRRMIDARYPDAPVYRVHWGSKELRDLGVLVLGSAGKRVAFRAATRTAMRGTAKASRLIPFVEVPLAAYDVAANPWTLAKKRAETTGAALADILTRTDGDLYVLVGHSLGARVMLTAAQAMGTRHGSPRLEDVHLLGAAVASKGDWRTLSESVSGRVLNYWSRKDKVLSGAYRSAQLGQTAAGSVGFNTRYRNIINCDSSAFVSSHSQYFETLVLR